METTNIKIFDNQEILKNKRFKDILNKTEKLSFSDEVVKVNKNQTRQKRNIILTTESIYNVMHENLITKIFFSKSSLVKRRISLTQIRSIVYANLGDEFVINVPDEFDYRIVTRHKDIFINHLMGGLESMGVKILLFYFTDDIQLAKYCTHKSEKEKGITRPPEGESKMQSHKQFKAFQDKRIIEENITDELTEVLLGSEKKITINDFVLLKTQGRGGFGTVYLAQKKDTKEIFAIKTIRKIMVAKKGYFEEVMREKEILQKANHPYLINLKCAFHTPDKLFLVMPFIQGGDQYVNLLKRKFLESEIKFYITQIVMAIQFLHSRSIVYQDLKPENVLLDSNGYIKLADFGAAKYVSGFNNWKGFIGTTDYIAPEVLNKLPYNKQVDWWTLGILIYELLYRFAPFTNPDKEIVYINIKKAKLRFPKDNNVSQECRDFISRCLQKDPSQRIGNDSDDEILSHKWFDSIDKIKLLNFEIPAPIIPSIKSETDVDYFDPKLTKERPKMTILDKKILDKLKQFDPVFDEYYYDEITPQFQKEEFIIESDEEDNFLVVKSPETNKDS